MTNNTEKNNSESKRKNLIFGISFVVLLCAIIIAAFISAKINDNKNENQENMLGVHIKGAVNNSGYYEVPVGTRVRDLESYVGGFKDNVLLDGVNLAAYVEDGGEVYFPYEGKSEQGALNLNTVTEEELKLLVDDIGEKGARDIVRYREQVGNFTSVLQLDEVLGKTKASKLYKEFFVEK